MGRVVNALADKGYETHHVYDESGDVVFSTFGLRKKDDEPVKEPLTVEAIKAQMEVAGAQFPDADTLSIAIRTQKAKDRIKSDQNEMSRRLKTARELLPNEAIEQILRNAIADHVAVGGHITDPNITSEGWRRVLQQATTELQASIANRVPDEPSRYGGF